MTTTTTTTTATTSANQKDVSQDGQPNNASPTKNTTTQSINSLLSQALEVPPLDHPRTMTSSYEEHGDNDGPEGESTSSSTGASTHKSLMSPSYPPSSLLLDASSPVVSAPIHHPSDQHLVSSPHVAPQASEDNLLLPQHSDFTVPTSNAMWNSNNNNNNKNNSNSNDDNNNHRRRVVDFDKAPPLEINPAAMMLRPDDDNDDDDDDDDDDTSSNRRSVFGSQVGRRYHVPGANPSNYPYARPSGSHSLEDNGGEDGTSASTSSSSFPGPDSPPRATYMVHEIPVPTVSPLTPAKTLHGRDEDFNHYSPDDLSPRRLLWQQQHQQQHQQQQNHRNNRPKNLHETIHAQSLLLGLAFMAVWSPNNAMAPNLTQMAESFQMTEAERDLYLGSYCALALGVFSLPISALLGFMADFYSRKHLFVCCVLGGSLASAWTGWSQTFLSLFWARLMSGGCMSASVPVAFSLLGDLFSTSERNAASSGLTAMMGLGILLGQVYAGTVGPDRGWQFPFFASSILSLSTALLVVLWVQEPDRGAQEKALQGLLQSGNKYERQLTFSGFMYAMRKNPSNSLLLWQGFFTSLPWGIVFCFLNDFLSQEKGFSVPDATFMVMLFGVGCAIGGIVGGYIGQKCQQHNRSLLPLFMAATTFCGMLPFLGLLNSEFSNKHGYKAMAYSILGGCIASLPSVNVRPCILNVNPPETRGAALTAANLLITLGRGIGPSCITLMGSIFHFSRLVSFNITLSVFWAITSVLLLFLVKTLPDDQDTMEEGLARYAAELVKEQESMQAVVNGYGSTNYSYDDYSNNGHHPHHGLLEDGTTGVGREPITPRSTSSEYQYHDDGTLVSIEDYRTSFDGNAARRSLQFVQQGIQEIKEEMACFTTSHGCGSCSGGGANATEQDREDNEAMEEILPQEELRKRRNLWRRQQQLLTKSQEEDENVEGKEKNEDTPFLRIV